MSATLLGYVNGLNAAADHLLAQAQDLEQIMARIRTQPEYTSTQTGRAELHALGDTARLLRAQSKTIRADKNLLTPRQE